MALLVGALFTLGLLCGEQAHAAEGALPTTSEASEISVTSVSAVSTSSLPYGKRDAGSPADDHALDPPADAADEVPVAGSAAGEPPVDETERVHVVQPVSRHVGRTVDTVHAEVTRPVGRLVDSVVERLAEAEAEAEAETGAELPSLPEFQVAWPSAPGYGGPPTFPELPGRPGLPGLPALPGQTLPAPVTTAPQPDSPVAPAVTEEQESQGRSAVAVSLAYGPRGVAGPIWTGLAEHAATHTSAHRAASAGYAPVRHAPPGNPGGAPAGKSAVDNGTPRHGDACAVTDNNQAPLRLRAGVAASAAADGTRDRHRDIPVFPG
ncbi:hypothetical protein AQJ84_30825 [Streptomyces resistomycificus]|uniref:Secreted protein n=1 Tax=Streptomyces resistomycificus TaxID=67356 RepID=A0A0L8L7A2_9ACTN|nr:hypothetical protein ADK37_20365 [Streptomyces resistomycificus]KUN92995.1 hypothetical protein AQJ84_30825 [Streptomyces resistomycificus]